MKTPNNIPDADLAELACRVAANEPLSTEETNLAAALQRDPANRARFQELVDTARTIRNITSAKSGEMSSEDSWLDDDWLASYAEGNLDKATAEKVEQELARSSYWLKQYAELAGMLAEVREETSPLTYVVRLFKGGLKLLSHPESGFSLDAVQAHGILADSAGEEAPVLQWRQSLDSVRITFRVWKTHCDAAHVEMLAEEGSEPIIEAQVKLYGDSGLLEVQRLSSEGKVRFDRLSPGQYTLELKQPERETISLGLLLEEELLQ